MIRFMIMTIPGYDWITTSLVRISISNGSKHIVDVIHQIMYASLSTKENSPRRIFRTVFFIDK